MSRNSSNARKHAIARTMKRAQNGKTGAESKGPVGPSKTTPKHGKNPDNRSRYNNANRKGRDLKKEGNSAARID